MTLVKYTSIEIRENNEPMVDLATFDFVLEPKYFQQHLSTEPRLFLREGTAKKLVQVQKNLAPFRLKIWDAFRSRAVQNNIYQKCWQEFKAAHPDWGEEILRLETGKFVSPPYEQNRIPPHATGGTVDLTLVDKRGHDLDMGTGFDYFGPESQSLYFEVHQDKVNITANRRRLREAMLAAGFTADENEWWHFDWGNQIWALKSGQPWAFYGEVDVDFISKLRNAD